MAGHFTEFGLLPELCQGVEDLGWRLPSDIQAEAIPAILGGGDVCLAAETGSGKTGAFCLPVVQVVQELLITVATNNAAGGAGKAVLRNFSFKMNQNDRDPQLKIGDDGLVCSSTLQARWQGCRAVTGITQGSAYYEAKIDNDGICRIGWSTRQGTLELGKDFFGFGFGGTGMKSFGAKFEKYGASFTKGDIVGCELDLVQKTISFSINGVNYGVAFRIPHDLSNSEFYPAVVLKNAQLTLNFGEHNFSFASKYNGLALCDQKILCSADSVSTAFKFSNVKSPSAIIIEPSRELANQTFQNILLFCKYLKQPKPNVSLLIGGGNPGVQMKELENGVDIVVCTPAKLFDFLSKQRILLREIRFFVLDEADACLDMDTNRIEDLWKQCPKLSADGRLLQTIICSATLHNPLVNRFCGNFIPHATWIDLKGQDTVPDTVHHVVCHVDPMSDKSWEQHKNSVPNDGVHSLNVRPTSGNPQDEYHSLGIKILKLLYTARAIQVHKMEQVIVFCRTRLDCENMKRYLTSLGGTDVAGSHQFSCRCLHSDMSADERNKSIIEFKKSQFRILICTAVAARGLDIRGVPYVICVTIPDDKATYLHIIGRVGRAERMGLAITFVGTNQEKVWYHQCKNVSCRNTNLNTQGGCCRWHTDVNFLTDIESYLVETIERVGTDMAVPVNEFDGVVTYGQKKKKDNQNAKLTEHGVRVQAKLADLLKLERQVQLNFLNIHEKICQRIQ